MRWTTNTAPVFDTQVTRTERARDELVAALTDMMPLLAKLSFLLRHTRHGMPGQGEDQDLFDEVQAIGHYAEKLGIRSLFPLLYRS